MPSKLFIKNMVCDRCIMMVKHELQNIGFNVINIKLGEVDLNQSITTADVQKIADVLHPLGFELIYDKKNQLIEKIKKIIIQVIHQQNFKLKNNLSKILSDELHHDYNYLSNLFSEIEGITIEKYAIAQKIERIKELLIYDELNLNEIADLLNYSSTAYLSNQFKKITGITPSQFKLNNIKDRTPLDKV